MTKFRATRQLDFFLHLFYVFKSQSALGCSVQKSMKCTSLPERTLAALSISWYHSNAWMLVQVGSQLLFWALPSQRTATLQNKRQKLEALSGRNEGTQIFLLGPNVSMTM
jgi:hypothetical protein